MKFYICGKIDTDHIEVTLLKHSAAAMQLNRSGHDAVSIAGIYKDIENKADADNARIDLMAQCEGLFLLPDWQEDIICQHELALASTMGKVIKAANQTAIPSRITFHINQ